MSFDAILARFAAQAPVATMVRAAMANILSPRELDAGNRRETQIEQFG